LKNDRTVKIIPITTTLRRAEALSFARKFRDLFRPYFIVDGYDHANRPGKASPRYRIVRIARKSDVVEIMTIEKEKLLRSI